MRKAMKRDVMAAETYRESRSSGGLHPRYSTRSEGDDGEEYDVDLPLLVPSDRRRSFKIVRRRDLPEHYRFAKLTPSNIPTVDLAATYLKAYGWVPEQLSKHFDEHTGVSVFWFLCDTAAALTLRNVPTPPDLVAELHAMMRDVSKMVGPLLRECQETRGVGASWTVRVTPETPGGEPTTAPLAEKEFNALYKSSKHFQYVMLPEPDGFDDMLGDGTFWWFDLDYLKSAPGGLKIPPGLNIFENLFIRCLSSVKTGIEFLDSLSCAMMNLLLVNKHFENKGLRRANLLPPGVLPSDPVAVKKEKLLLHLADVSRKIMDAVTGLLAYPYEDICAWCNEYRTKFTTGQIIALGLTRIDEWAATWTYLCYWFEAYAVRARSQFKRRGTSNCIALLELLGLCLSITIRDTRKDIRGNNFVALGKIWDILLPSTLAVARAETMFFYSRWFTGSDDKAAWRDALIACYSVDNQEPTSHRGAYSMASRPKERCAICGKPATQTCGGCGRTFYCSEKHAKDDWARHGVMCAKSKTTPNVFK